MEKLFPSEGTDTPEQNVLLSTIRVPKNLLFLTDRLPKPNYASEESRNRRTTTGCDYILPALVRRFKPAVASGRVKDRNKYRRMLEVKAKEGETGDESLAGKTGEKTDVSDISREIVDIQLNGQGPISGAKRPRRDVSVNPRPHPKESSEVRNNNKSMVARLEESPGERTPEKPVDKTADLHPIRARDGPGTISPVADHSCAGVGRTSPGKPKDTLGLGTKLPHESPEPRPPRFRIRRRDRQLLDSLLNGHDYSPYVPDARIRQIMARRNPVVRPANGSLQALANIYAGGLGQLSIVSRRVGNLKLPKMGARKEETSLSPYLQRGIRGLRQNLSGLYEGGSKARLQALSPLKPRGDVEPPPGKLIGYAMMPGRNSRSVPPAANVPDAEK